MRRLLPLVFAALALAACGPGDCLPERATDATPPTVAFTVTYTDRATGTPTERRVRTSDPEITLDADAAAPVRVHYEGADAEGLRRLQLGVTIQQTVAVGAERRTLNLAPVAAPCPQAALEGRWEHTPDGPRNLLIGAVAANWASGTAATPTVAVRLRPAGAEAP